MEETIPWDQPNLQKLEAMFLTLRKQGFRAKKRYQCCQGCGSRAIQEDVFPGVPYAFYHEQDQVDIVEGGVLYIAYGICNKDVTPDEMAKVGYAICRAADAAGLFTVWDGDVLHRVGVGPIFHKAEVTA